MDRGLPESRGGTMNGSPTTPQPPRAGRRRLPAAALTLALAVMGTMRAPLAQGGLPPMPEWIDVAGATLAMGAGTDPEAYDNERWPSATGTGPVSVAGFLLARTETTVAQFGAFAVATGWRSEPRALAGAPELPVTFVSWTDAVAYARWLDRALRSTPSAPAVVRDRLAAGWHVRLPSEAQWELAARATDGRRYPWGNEARPDRATYNTTGPTPVGQHPCPECVVPLADMSGNVWEWTSSPYQPYPFTTADDRTGLEADALWVMRGGHFGDPPRLLRATARGAAEPGARRAFIGFRVALVPPAR